MFNFILYYFQKEVKNSFISGFTETVDIVDISCVKNVKKNLSSCVSSYFIETESLKRQLFTGFILKLRLHLINHSLGSRIHFWNFRTF